MSTRFCVCWPDTKCQRDFLFIRPLAGIEKQSFRRNQKPQIFSSTQHPMADQVSRLLRDIHNKIFAFITLQTPPSHSFSVLRSKGQLRNKVGAVSSTLRDQSAATNPHKLLHPQDLVQNISLTNPTSSSNLAA